MVDIITGIDGPRDCAVYTSGSTGWAVGPVIYGIKGVDLEPYEVADMFLAYLKAVDGVRDFLGMDEGLVNRRLSDFEDTLKRGGYCECKHKLDAHASHGNRQCLEDSPDGDVCDCGAFDFALPPVARPAAEGEAMLKLMDNPKRDEVRG